MVLHSSLCAVPYPRAPNQCPFHPPAPPPLLAGTIGKRFAQIEVENNQDNRRAYREMLFRAEGLNEVRA